MTLLALVSQLCMINLWGFKKGLKNFLQPTHVIGFKLIWLQSMTQCIPVSWNSSQHWLTSVELNPPPAITKEAWRYQIKWKYLYRHSEIVDSTTMIIVSGLLFTISDCMYRCLRCFVTVMLLNLSYQGQNFTIIVKNMHSPHISRFVDVCMHTIYRAAFESTTSVDVYRMTA